jgi:cation diffusion facilitator CzcD-associated flavoprotein CzcO
MSAAEIGLKRGTLCLMALRDSMEGSDILILGAGPAGLSLGSELTRRGVSFQILERGQRAGESWRRMPARMKLVSPWKANWLPGGPSAEFSAHAEISRADYAAWLETFARRRALPILTGVDVLDVARTREGIFHLTTTLGELTTRLLVNATGCFSNPFVPPIPGADDTAILQRHTADYQDPETLRALIGGADPLVLIVGRRLSAGQTMVELVDAGFRVALSCRGPVQFGSGPIGAWVFFRIHPWLEAQRLRRHGAAARGFDPRMPGGRARRLVESRAVRVLPEIARFDHKTVVFQNGDRLQPAAVVYATGFRPALQHLASLPLELDAASGRPQTSGMESVPVPGLFFIGVDHVRNFQSRFLRGIRQDAGFLAERLEQRLHGPCLPRLVGVSPSAS